MIIHLAVLCASQGYVQPEDSVKAYRVAHANGFTAVPLTELPRHASPTRSAVTRPIASGVLHRSLEGTSFLSPERSTAARSNATALPGAAVGRQAGSSWAEADRRGWTFKPRVSKSPVEKLLARIQRSGEFQTFWLPLPVVDMSFMDLSNV